jgi:hypothetical protein
LYEHDMQGESNLRMLDLSGVALSAEIGPDGSLHAVGGEYPKVMAALFTKDLPRIHTIVFAKDQDLSAFHLIRDEHFPRPNFFRERQPQSDFVIITAESLAEAIEFVYWRHGQMKAGDLSGNLPRRNPDFVGRVRLFEQLERWIRSTPSGYLLIIGGVGRGKTTFLSECVHRGLDRGEVPVRHFIDYHPSDTGRPDSIAESLYHQLRIKYALREPTDWLELSEADRLERLLRERVAPSLNGSKEVMFVDAADQSELTQLQILLPGVLRQRLPEGVLCVITSRYQLAWLGTQLSTTWDWDECAEDRTDVGIYLRRVNRALGSPLGESIIAKILGQSEPPVFFTVKKNLEQLTATTCTVEAEHLRSDPSLWVLPPDELIETDARLRIRLLAQQGITEQRFWRTLGLLACAAEDLSSELMQELLVWEEGVTDVVLRTGANFFKTDMQDLRPQTKLGFDHPGYQRTVIGDPNDPVRHPGHLSEPDRRDCHVRLADGCWHALVHGDSAFAIRYAVEHLPHHLRQAGRTGQLIPFLSDFHHVRQIVARIKNRMPHANAMVSPQQPSIGDRFITLCFDALSSSQAQKEPKLHRVYDHRATFVRIIDVLTRAEPIAGGDEPQLDMNARCNFCAANGLVRGIIDSDARDIGDQMPVFVYIDTYVVFCPNCYWLYSQYAGPTQNSMRHGIAFSYESNVFCYYGRELRGSQGEKWLFR